MTRVALLTVLAGAILTASAPAQGWAEKMVKGSLSHDFGIQPRGTVLEKEFEITNIYAVQMEITSLKSGCGCVTATALKRILEPRETTKIIARVDTTRVTGPKTVGVRVTVGPNFISSAELRVSVNVRTDIVFNPGQVNFGNVLRGQSPTQTVDVEYAGALAWQVSEVITKDIPYTVAIKETYRRPGGVGYRLAVTLKPEAPLGSLRHYIYLKTNDTATPLVPVLVEANVQSAITVVPETLNLGPIKTDAPLIRRVVVRSSRPFRITGVEGVGAGVELGAPLGTNEEAVQFLTFKIQPTMDGAFRHEIKIKTNLQDTPVVVSIDGVAMK